MIYKKLFSPIKLNNCLIKNRIVSSAHHTELVKDGMITDDFIAYHTERAKGGCGLIIIECVAVKNNSLPTSAYPQGFNEKNLPLLKDLTNSVHKYNTKILAQIWHGGAQIESRFTQNSSFSPSGIPCPYILDTPKKMEIEEIKNLIKEFIYTALSMQDAGFDGVEIHCAHGYLLHQFLSPLTNKRNDEYGGSFENRIKLPMQVIQEVRKAINPEFIVGVRLCGDDFLPGGIDINLSQQIAKNFAKSGLIDYLSISCGSYGTFFCIVPPMNFPPSCFTYAASSIKEIVDIPIMGVGRINDPQQAEKILQDNLMDFVCMTRAQICDPYLAQKAKEAREDEIRRCIGCNQGCFGRIFKSFPISCIQNPVAGREKFFNLTTIKEKKNIYIVGGGPTGLSCAKVCAEKGHQVFLFEKEENLGGQVLSAKDAIHRSELEEVITYLEKELKKLKVEIHTKTNITKELLLSKIKSEDVVIIATGSQSVKEPFPPNLVFAIPPKENFFVGEEILKTNNIGNEILIYATFPSIQSLTIAETLLSKKKKVIFISSGILPDFIHLEVVTSFTTYARVLKGGGDFYSYTMVTNVTDNTAYAINILSQKFFTFNFDSFVYFLGRQPEDNLYYALKDKIKNLYLIGDCEKPATIEEAIYSGYKLGYEL